MTFIHEYDKNGNHRLRVQVSDGVPSDIVGEWAAFQSPAFVTTTLSGNERTFAAHTDFDTRFPPVYEIKPATEAVIITDYFATTTLENGPFFITDAIGAIVGGFDEEHQVVFIVEKIKQAKKFATREEALTWGKAHADCGYGFNTGYGAGFIVREVK